MNMTLIDNGQQNVSVIVSVDNDGAYQSIDWLNEMEKQLTSVCKITEQFLSERPNVRSNLHCRKFVKMLLSKP
jgi:hypothetical protein